MGIVISILAFLFVFGILVVIHELGHFLTAKLFKVGVEEFAFGLPPRLVAKKVGDTVYAINALPIGGYVKMIGEDTLEPNNPLSLQAKPPWQRLIILLAGSFTHFVLAFIIFFALALIQGKSVPNGKVDVISTSPGSPAEQAGLKIDDKITSITGQTFKNSDGFLTIVGQNKGKLISLQVERNGQTLALTATPRLSPPAGQGALGVVVEGEQVSQKVGFLESLQIGVTSVGEVVSKTFEGLGTLLHSLFGAGRVPADISGPVGIAKISGQVAQSSGLLGLVVLLAIFAANLAVFNLLPFPALDGGRAVFVLFEWIFHRRVPADKEAIVHAVGIALLMLLVVAVTYKDILQLFGL